MKKILQRMKTAGRQVGKNANHLLPTCPPPLAHLPMHPSPIPSVTVDRLLALSKASDEMMRSVFRQNGHCLSDTKGEYAGRSG